MATIAEIKEIVSNNDRYEGLTWLDESLPFNELFKNKDIDVVQPHSSQIYEYDDGTKDIIGFFGAFRWSNNECISLDGDIYSKDCRVIAYEWFECEDGTAGLDVLLEVED